jgi:hypothetical protein
LGDSTLFDDGMTIAFTCIGRICSVWFGLVWFGFWWFSIHNNRNTGCVCDVRISIEGPKLHMVPCI